MSDDVELQIEDTLGEVFDRMQEQPDTPALERDDAGKFASKTVEQPEAVQTTETPPAQEARPKRARPSMLPHDLDWDGLPETWQEYVDRREKEVAKGFEARAKQLKNYEPIEQVLEPRRAKLRAHYGSEAAAINHLLSLAEYAEQDPQGFMSQFAAARGLPPLELSQAPQGVQTQRHFDPEAAVRQEFERIEAERAFAEFQAQHADDAYINEQRYSDTGDVQYPFRSLMAAMLNAGVATNLAEAYEMAKYARPDIRQQLTAKQLADERAKWEEEAKKRAQDAQRANGLNVRGSPAPRLPAKGKSMDDTLAEVFDRMNAA
jgi:hypothetical protein